MTSRIPPAVARRIDRLARSAHAFHRFAHHPLCQEYAGELVALGRRGRVCKGCLLVAAGAIAGSIAGMVLRPPGAVLLAGALSFGAATLLWMRARKTSTAKIARAFYEGKVFTRALPIAAAAFAICSGLRSFTIIGELAALITGAVLLAGFLVYRKHGPSRAPCRVCPERLAQPCRGVRPIWRREQAFTRRAQQLLAAAPQAR